MDNLVGLENKRKAVFTTYAMTNSQNKTETVAIGFTKTDNGIDWDDEIFLSKNDPNFLETLKTFLTRSDNHNVKLEPKNLDNELKTISLRYNKLKNLKG